MGCYIHIYAEKRNNNNEWEMYNGKFTADEWYEKYYKKEYINRPFYLRNYEMFGILAGVRDHDVELISYPKGIPSDISNGVFLEYRKWLSNVHSESWLTARELIEYRYSRKFINDNELFFIHLEELKNMDSIDDVRIVFWFDN